MLIFYVLENRGLLPALGSIYGFPQGARVQC